MVLMVALMAISVVMLLPVAIGSLWLEGLPTLGPGGWTAVMYVGICLSLLAYAFYNRAVSELGRPGRRLHEPDAGAGSTGISRFSWRSLSALPHGRHGPDPGRTLAGLQPSGGTICRPLFAAPAQYLTCFCRHLSQNRQTKINWQALYDDVFLWRNDGLTIFSTDHALHCRPANVRPVRFLCASGCIRAGRQTQCPAGVSTHGMKHNLPVLDRETVVPPGLVLVSRTNPWSSSMPMMPSYRSAALPAKNS